MRSPECFPLIDPVTFIKFCFVKLLSLINSGKLNIIFVSLDKSFESGLGETYLKVVDSCAKELIEKINVTSSKNFRYLTYPPL
ncbi:hypothetical protein BMS3Abin03_01448 [bacterium BMS3Abin03]|nr:hypothetical protein BMS3Abin03_01448 [bacterium BMS3Abin03]